LRLNGTPVIPRRNDAFVFGQVDIGKIIWIGRSLPCRRTRRLFRGGAGRLDEAACIILIRSKGRFRERRSLVIVLTVKPSAENTSLVYRLDGHQRGATL
jgi:hypothetical protein